jgi:hypothetical protein
MPAPLTCRHGHHWQSNHPPAPGEATLVCPVCGALPEFGPGQPTMPEAENPSDALTVDDRTA